MPKRRHGALSDNLANGVYYDGRTTTKKKESTEQQDREREDREERLQKRLKEIVERSTKTMKPSEVDEWVRNVARDREENMARAQDQQGPRTTNQRRILQNLGAFNGEILMGISSSQEGNTERGGEQQERRATYQRNMVFIDGRVRRETIQRIPNASLISRTRIQTPAIQTPRIQTPAFQIRRIQTSEITRLSSMGQTTKPDLKRKRGL